MAPPPRSPPRLRPDHPARRPHPRQYRRVRAGRRRSVTSPRRRSARHRRATVPAPFSAPLSGASGWARGSPLRPRRLGPRRTSPRLRRLAVTQDLGHLGSDRDRHFGRRHRADCKSDRPVDASKIIIAEAQFLEPRTTPGVVAARAESADVEAVRTQRRGQRRVVDLRVMGQGHDRRAAIRLQPFERFVGPFLRQLDIREPRLRRERSAGVDDGHGIVCHREHPGQRLRDMHRTNDEAAMEWREDFYEDTAGPSLDGPVAAGTPSLAHPVERRLVERQIPLGMLALEQQLPARSQIGCESDAAVLSLRRQNLVENAPLHSTRSTNIWILPPQARPTSQAWSLVTPKSRSRGLPSRIPSSASSTTAPSTQPPDTEPTMAPVSLTASLAPTGRGEEPHVVTTVANATPDPASRQRAACSRISAVSLMLPSPGLRAMASPPSRAAWSVRSAPRSTSRGFRDCAPGGTHRHTASSPSCREILARTPRSATAGSAKSTGGTRGAAGPFRAQDRRRRRGRARR